ncbi:MAG: DUF421 domain-containing protein [Oscillospiraceae bacterium]|nr:DUF421 domain-containing protein [Oscillospiraceae bacterium]
MEFIKIILTSVGSIIAMFISTKITGKKQMSELSMFDYINGITIGSIAAEMATSLEGDVYYPLTAIAVYTIVMWLISYISEKSVKCRRILAGKAILLMENGKIYQKNFKKSNIDINDFLAQCRINGYFKLDDIDTAILEENGKVSILPKAGARPVTTQDLALSVTQDTIMYTVIADGHILEENLKRAGKNKQWLEKELYKNKVSNINDVFIAECDRDNLLFVFTKNKSNPENDPFQ